MVAVFEFCGSLSKVVDELKSRDLEFSMYFWTSELMVGRAEYHSGVMFGMEEGRDGRNGTEPVAPH